MTFWTVFWILVLLPIVYYISLHIQLAFLRSKREKVEAELELISIQNQAEYQDALEALATDPTNVALRQIALEKGRSAYSSYEDRAAAELEVGNDINAICVGRASPQSYADELEKLAMLQKDGVITIEEFQNLKNKMASKPSQVQDVIRLLRGLKDLEREGVVTQSEFNMKKWDVLARNFH